MLLILAPDEASVADLLAVVEVRNTKTVGNIAFYTVSRYGVRFLVAVSGYGKVNISRTITLAAEYYTVSSVLGIGTAGSLGTYSPKLFSAVICGDTFQYDVNFTRLGEPRITLPDMPTGIFSANSSMILQAKAAVKAQGLCCPVARIASADRFVANSRLCNCLCNCYGATAVDAECGPIGEICFLTGIPFVVIKVVCNCAREDAPQQYRKYSQQALRSAQSIAMHYVRGF